jgi:Flp pilus assembly pilin Flp
MYIAAKTALASDSGQNLVEYGMAVALIAFGCVAGETAIASSVNQTFVNISTVITTGIAR